jgi:SAM-dependent methyltransferase
MRPRGWFEIPGVQHGDRTLDEQLLGLDAALAEAAGKRVLDLGCAEGLIAARFIEAGAQLVHGVEIRPQFLVAAQSIAGRGHPNLGHGLTVDFGDLNEGLPKWLAPPYDMVLALAILHKLRYPTVALQRMAKACLGLLVIRLPLGSQGEFGSKHFRNQRCDLRAELPALGFRLERDAEGPRGERVHYWRRG